MAAHRATLRASSKAQGFGLPTSSSQRGRAHLKKGDKVPLSCDSPPDSPLYDQMVQTAHKLVLERTFAADFYASPNGHRRGRRTQDAVAQIALFATHRLV